MVLENCFLKEWLAKNTVKTHFKTKNKKKQLIYHKEHIICL